MEFREPLVRGIFLRRLNRFAVLVDIGAFPLWQEQGPGQIVTGDPLRSLPPFPAAGAIQWLVGPASSLSRQQIKVRCSVRATSLGSLRWR